MGTLASGATGPVLVIGATRGTGRLIAERLVANGTAVRALARNPERARAELPSVEIVAGDLTKKETITPAVAGVRHIICTAGRRSGRISSERQIKAVEFDGVVNVLAAAKASRFSGRFMYMTASSVAGSRSFATWALNFYKGNTLKWRTRLEDEIRASGIEYTIVRAGVLLNRPGGEREIVVTQKALQLSLFHRISRADVADAFVAALDHPRARNATFSVIWGNGPRRTSWSDLLATLQPDVHT